LKSEIQTSKVNAKGGRFRRAWTQAGGVILITFLLSIAWGDSAVDASPKHLIVAEELVRQLHGVTDNHYGGGKRHIDWDAHPLSARTVCSSFVTLLLMHSYDFSESDIRKWLHRTNPVAADYHDAIIAHNHFLQVTNAHDILPGDILAVKYTDGHLSRDGVEDSGHVMVVEHAPEAMAGETEVAPGAHLFKVWVIDSTASGHGIQDSRHLGPGEFTGGIGKGIMRIAVDPHADAVVAYSWSDGQKSEFFKGPARDLVVGRLDPAKLK